MLQLYQISRITVTELIEHAALVSLALIALVLYFPIAFRTIRRFWMLYLFGALGFLILASDLKINFVFDTLATALPNINPEQMKEWKAQYAEYAPHFASELIVTFAALAFLERGLEIARRHHAVRRQALAGMRFILSRAEDRNLYFTVEGVKTLEDDQVAFEFRRPQYVRYLRAAERKLYDAGSETRAKLIQMIKNYATLRQKIDELASSIQVMAIERNDNYQLPQQLRCLREQLTVSSSTLDPSHVPSPDISNSFWTAETADLRKLMRDAVELRANLISKMDEFRALYQKCRKEIWSHSDPDEV